MLMFMDYKAIVLMLCLNGCLSTIVKPCKTGTLLTDDKIMITNCEKPPCILKKGTNSSITVYITADRQIEKVYNNIYGVVGGVKAPYPGLDGKSACNLLYLAADDSQPACPLTEGTEYYYKLTVPVKKSYPKVDGLLHWAIKEKGASEPIACFEVDIKIT